MGAGVRPAVGIMRTFAAKLARGPSTEFILSKAEGLRTWSRAFRLVVPFVGKEAGRRAAFVCVRAVIGL